MGSIKKLEMRKEKTGYAGRKIIKNYLIQRLMILNVNAD